MHTSKYIYTILIIYFLCLKVSCRTRERRTLIYPPPKSKVQLIYGIGLPVALEDISVVRGYVVKANYFLPFDAWNITNPETIITRKKRDTQIRWNFYNILGSFLTRFGGKSCVLKSVCEFAEFEIDRSGLFEEFLHVLFRYGPSSTEDLVVNAMDQEFLSAEKFGRSNRGVCGIVYSDCSISLMQYLTV